MLNCNVLSKKEAEQVNKCVRGALVLREQAKVGKKRSATCGTYIGYTPEEGAKIGKTQL